MAGRRSVRVSIPSTRSEPTAAEVEILLALAQFHYLTVEQVVRALGYSPSTKTTVSPRLTRLWEHGYCVRGALPLKVARPGGTGAYVYALGNKGRSLVTTLGREVPARFRPSDFPSSSYLPHVVACADVYVSAALLGRQDGFTLERLVVERELRARDERVRVDGRTQKCMPDGWFSLIGTRHDGRRVRFPITLEVDLHTEKQTKWREKIRRLMAWIDGPYEAVFGTPRVTVAVVCPDNAPHAATLRAWTAAELIERKRPEAGKNFVFSGVNAATAAPEDVFLSRIWSPARGEKAVPLLELEVGSG